MMAYLQRDVVWTPFSRSRLKGTYRFNGLTWLFVVMVLALSVATWSAVRHVGDIGVEVSGVSRIAKALGATAPERVRDGYDPNAPAQAPAGPPAAQADVAAVSPPVPAGSVAAPSAGGASAGPGAGGRMRIVNTDGLGVVLRTAPREDARVPRGLSAGALVTVLGREGDQWVHVRGDNRLEGWVPGRYLAPAN